MRGMCDSTDAFFSIAGPNPLLCTALQQIRSPDVAVSEPSGEISEREGANRVLGKAWAIPGPLARRSESPPNGELA